MVGIYLEAQGPTLQQMVNKMMLTIVTSPSMDLHRVLRLAC